MMATATSAGPIIVYSNSFGDDSPRFRQAKAKQMFERATLQFSKTAGVAAKAMAALEDQVKLSCTEYAVPPMRRCELHGVLFSTEGSCIVCARDAQYLDDYVRMQRDEVRPPRRWFDGSERALASALWSRQLREKVRASAAADRDRELHQVVIDYFDD